MAQKDSDNSNRIIETQLDVKLKDLELQLSGNVIAFVGPLYGGIDDFFRHVVEEIKEAQDINKKAKIVVCLETNGGQIEVVERIVQVLRHHYKRVEFIVPDHAMSAGTVLAMSGDAIYMDYYSVLGPIDPQIQKPDGGGFVPALGYLEKYQEFLEKSSKGKLTSAELAYFVKRFDQAELYRFEQSRELSVTLLKEWLVKYKFRFWKKTETRKKKVTLAMKRDRAEFIARKLQEVSRWHTHARGINMHTLKKNLKLKIEDFGTDNKLNSVIRSYDRLLSDYMGRLGHNCAINSRIGYKGFRIS